VLLFASGIAHAERPKILVLPVAGKVADPDSASASPSR
jgi:hypothetical protein